MTTQEKEIEAFFDEAREALKRQRGSSWDRGDGKTIMDCLEEFLDWHRDGVIKTKQLRLMH